MPSSHRPSQPTPPCFPAAGKEGDLDLSFPAYREVTGMWPHRLQISWRWADISSYIDGSMKASL